jgi:hypothetical protein
MYEDKQGLLRKEASGDGPSQRVVGLFWWLHKYLVMSQLQLCVRVFLQTESNI